MLGHGLFQEGKDETFKEGYKVELDLSLPFQLPKGGLGLGTPPVTTNPQSGLRLVPQDLVVPPVGLESGWGTRA